MIGSLFSGYGGLDTAVVNVSILRGNAIALPLAQGVLDIGGVS